jgi:hypothetical protein
MRKSDLISFRVEADEMKELSEEGVKRRMSVNTVARDWMRSWRKFKEKQEAQERELTQLRREIGRVRIDLANVCMMLLCRAGKETSQQAEKWVRENLLGR